MRGFSAVGLVRPKRAENVGGVFRAAHCYRCAFLALQERNARFQWAEDTPKSWQHMPVFRTDDLRNLVPAETKVVAVDIVEGAAPLPLFHHPERAFYIFGPEDGTLKEELKWADKCVMIPTRDCMNLAAAVNVVLYDRMAKAMRS